MLQTLYIRISAATIDLQTKDVRWITSFDLNQNIRGLLIQHVVRQWMRGKFGEIIDNQSFYECWQVTPSSNNLYDIYATNITHFLKRRNLEQGSMFIEGEFYFLDAIDPDYTYKSLSDAFFGMSRVVTN